MQFFTLMNVIGMIVINKIIEFNVSKRDLYDIIYVVVLFLFKGGFMELVDLKCKKCGGNLEIDEYSVAYCQFCNSKYVLEEAKSDNVHNMTINNYGVGMNGDFQAYPFQEHRKYKDAQNTKNIFFSIVFVVVFVFILIPFFRGINFYSDMGIRERDFFTSGETTAPLDYESMISYELYADYEKDALSEIVRMVNLEEIYIREANCLQDYSFLSHLSKLKTIHIEDAENLKDLNFLKKISALENLTVIDSGLQDISALENSSILQLRLRDSEYIEDYTVISSLKRLKYLEIEA